LFNIIVPSSATPVSQSEKLELLPYSPVFGFVVYLFIGVSVNNAITSLSFSHPSNVFRKQEAGTVVDLGIIAFVRLVQPLNVFQYKREVNPLLNFGNLVKDVQP
jgi:hypothetical protein